MSVLSSQISYTYPGQKTLVLPEITCKSGETLLILGASGVGKTTLGKILAGLLQPDEGEVQINETALFDLSPKKRDAFRGKQIGFIPQSFSFAESLSAWDHFRLYARWSSKPASRKEVRQLLDEIGIQDCLDKKASALSGGEQQRLAIALGIFHNPSVIIADEPTSQLDDKNCNDVVDVLVQLQKSHPFALLIISHDQRLKNRFSNVITL